MHDPSIAGVFLANVSELLDEASAGDPRERILEVVPEPIVETDQLAEVAAAFGDLVDLKTPFAHGHAAGVARPATAAAEDLRLDAATVWQLHVAALLHDLGRVGVSNVIWEKPGPLTSGQWEQVCLHPYQSERILRTSRTLEPIAGIVGMHHERLDGSGYHRGCRGHDIPAASRVLAAADAFHAMTQPRPRR